MHSCRPSVMRTHGGRCWASSPHECRSCRWQGRKLQRPGSGSAVYEAGGLQAQGRSQCQPEHMLRRLCCYGRSTSTNAPTKANRTCVTGDGQAEASRSTCGVSSSSTHISPQPSGHAGRAALVHNQQGRPNVSPQADEGRSRFLNTPRLPIQHLEAGMRM